MKRLAMLERPKYAIGDRLLCINKQGTTLRRGDVYEVVDNTDPETGQRSALLAVKERPGVLFHPLRFKPAP